MTLRLSNLAKAAGLGLAFLITGCDQPTITMKVVGGGEVIASTGDSCLDKNYNETFPRDTDSPCIVSSDEEVTFTAEPYDGYVFYGWDYACSGSEATCTTEGAGGSFTLRPSASTPVAALFYTEEVIDAVNSLTTDDLGMRNCIAEAMMQQGITDLDDVTAIACRLGHPIVWPTSIDLGVLNQLSNLQDLSLTQDQVFRFYARGGSDVVPGLSLAQVSALPNLQSFTLDELVPEDFDLNSTELLELNLNLVPNGDISFLANLPNLQSLEIGIVTIYDEDLDLIAGLSSLTKLDISAGNLTSFEALSSLSNLTSVTLVYPEATDASPFANMTTLEELNLQGMEIEDFSFLNNLTNLRDLVLYGTDLDDTELAQIGALSFPEMRNLSLSRNDIADLSPLTAANLPQIEELGLNLTHVMDVTPLYGLTTLQTLRIGSQSDAPDIIPCSVEDDLNAVLPDLHVITYTTTHYKNGELIWMSGCNPSDD